MHSAPAVELRADALRVSVPGRTLVSDLDFTLAGGQFMAILGENGAGKSLSLHTLAGIRSPDAGCVMLNGTSIQELPRRRVAQLLALLPQDTEDIFPATVLDTVMTGRHPHIGRFQWESQADIEIAQAALQKMDLGGTTLARRDVDSLSGGERRRAAIAQVLTQAPDVYLLDEPTNHLDPQHQLDVLQTFRAAADAGSLVLASLHDVNLASRYADQCLLLFGDGRWNLGPTQEILTEASLTELYSTPIEAVAWRDQTLFVACG